MPVPESGVLVLVGPNNTGKSAALREVYQQLAGQLSLPQQPFRVVTGIDLAKEGDAEILREWLEDNTHAFTIRSTGERRYSRPQAQIVWSQAQHEWAAHPNALGPQLAPIFVLPSYTEQRLNLISQASHWNPAEESPTAPLQILFADPELEATISSTAHEAFGEPLHLSRFPGGPIDLYVGSPQSEPSAILINEEYVEEIRSMPLLREQGDGMRSFVGIMLALIAARYPIILLDEPEAFLHPPQARLVGQKIATESRDTQVLLATHSTDVLLGLLRGGAADVTVVRLTRSRGVNPVSVLSHEQLGQLWSDPLLASSNLLDGLFHRGVVLCEGDTDARYYSTVLDHDRGNRAHELFFTHCGGKQRMPMVVRALKALDVPVVTVTDLDVLREEPRVRAIVEALGADWEEFARDWRIVDGAASAMSAAPAVADARNVVETTLDEAATAGPRLTDAASQKIRAATKVETGWDVLKKRGVAGLPQGEETAAAERLLAGLSRIGLFAAPVGEVERWHASVPHKSTVWLDGVLAEGLYVSAGPHHEFVRNVAAWFDS